MDKGKKRKEVVYLNTEEQITKRVNSNGVIVEYLEDNDRYEIKFNYFFGKLIGLTKKDLMTNKIKRISLFKIAFQKLAYITEYNEKRKYLTTTDQDSRIVRDLYENFILT